MPTTIDSAGITFNDATSFTSALIPTTSLTGTIAGTQIANGSVIAAKLGTDEQKQIAKAWVNFNGTTSPGTIRSSYNVSSVTRLSTGVYTINFQTSLLDSNYSAIASSAVGASSGFSCTANTSFTFNSNNVTFQFQYGGAFGLENSSTICVQIFGN